MGRILWHRGVPCLLLLVTFVYQGCGTEDPENGREHQEESGHSGEVRISDAELQEFGVRIETAGPATLTIERSLPGEIRINADRLVHVTSPVSGIVREVHHSVGDQVVAGETLVILESRELADAKVAWLNACERLDVADANLKRAAKLLEKNIVTEKDFLEARMERAAARNEYRSARQKLLALGFSNEFIDALREDSDRNFTRYEIRVPLEGEVVDRHVSLGEVVAADQVLFTIADLSTVWVDLSIYPKDLPFIRVGQETRIACGGCPKGCSGRLAYVRPLLHEGTRTSVGRLILENPDGHLRPGMFVTGRVTVRKIRVPVAVPKTALQRMEGRDVVFVRTSEGFKPVEVRTGREDEDRVEIVSGLAPGQPFAARGAFVLKAELEKAGFAEGHEH